MGLGQLDILKIGGELARKKRLSLSVVTLRWEREKGKRCRAKLGAPHGTEMHSHTEGTFLDSETCSANFNPCFC